MGTRNALGPGATVVSRGMVMEKWVRVLPDDFAVACQRGAFTRGSVLFRKSSSFWLTTVGPARTFYGKTINVREGKWCARSTQMSIVDKKGP